MHSVENPSMSEPNAYAPKSCIFKTVWLLWLANFMGNLFLPLGSPPVHVLFLKDCLWLKGVPVPTAFLMSTLYWMTSPKSMNFNVTLILPDVICKCFIWTSGYGEGTGMCLELWRPGASFPRHHTKCFPWLTHSGWVCRENFVHGKLNGLKSVIYQGLNTYTPKLLRKM